MLREFERAELLKYRPFAAFGAYVRRAGQRVHSLRLPEGLLSANAKTIVIRSIEK